MKSLVFTTVIREALDAALSCPPTKPNPSAQNGATEGWYKVRLHDAGALVLESENGHTQTNAGSTDVQPHVAWLRVGLVDGEPAWELIPRTGTLGLNHLPACLPLAKLEPGDLLTLGDRLWMAASLWTPEPVVAPDTLRDKPCPICGGQLGLAQVVECVCGRWTHLENPSSPNDAAALNCFLAAGRCGHCGRPAILEPQLFPEVADCLIAEWTDEDDFVGAAPQ